MFDREVRRSVSVAMIGEKDRYIAESLGVFDRRS